MRYKPHTIQYGGYRFRSRLEAKWATFLDYLMVEYDYEPKRFHLNETESYLPDFWLKEQDLFLEIKPNKKLSSKDERKIRLFASQKASESSLIVCVDEPDMWQENLIIVRENGTSNVEWAWNDLEQKAMLQEKGARWGDPHHPTIYSAIDHSRNYTYIRVDT